jgi:hypothetical protein
LIDVSGLRIVEIGHAYIRSAYPQQTQSFVPYPINPEIGVTLSARNLPRLHRALRAPDLSLIVCHPRHLAPWHLDLLKRELFDRRSWQGWPRLAPAIGIQMLRLPLAAPIAVLDPEDVPLISRSDAFLLERCRLYFKRELPADRWRLFLNTAANGMPTTRFRRRSPLRRHLEKLRPISLGMPQAATQLAPFDGEKTVDVFFAGDVETSSTVRRSGMAELLALRERGLRIDIPATRLPPDEFYRRCAQAWIVWSPEGLGWDCFRHYEALACNAVPLINQPTIERYQPLVHGVHALFYAPEPGGLTRTIMAALADKERLQAIARDGRAHALAHHTPAAISRHIVESTLLAAAERR